MGPRAGLDAVVRRKIPSPLRYTTELARGVEEESEKNRKKEEGEGGG
jgi:hypothetical protein